jgi:hypothetical protein
MCWTEVWVVQVRREDSLDDVQAFASETAARDHFASLRPEEDYPGQVRVEVFAALVEPR